MKSKIFGAAIAIALAMPAAQADTYNWDWTSGAFHGSGTLTDNGGVSGTGFIIDTFTGTFSCSFVGCPFSLLGTPVTLLPPGTIVAPVGPASIGNDNVLYPNADAPGGALLDGAGLGLTTSDGFAFKIYNEVVLNIPIATGYTQFTGGSNFSSWGLGDFCIEKQEQRTCPAITQFQGVPGTIAGAGSPGLLLASGGLLAWWRRKLKANVHADWPSAVT